MKSIDVMDIKTRQINLLRKSIKWWRFYRKIKKDSKIDLSNTNLSNLYLNYTDLSNTNLSGANLSGAALFCTDLSNSDLSNTNLSDARLSHTNLSGANLDYSCLQLSCKTLFAKLDEKHIIQILYHAAKPCVVHQDIVKDQDLKELLNSELFKKVVNKFHHIDECGKI